MSIAVNNVVTDVASSSPKSYTVSHSNAILVVAIAMAWASENAVNSMTYNGVALTRAGMRADPYDWGRAELWYLVNPATGANNLVINSEDNSVAPIVIEYLTGASLIGVGNSGNNASESASQTVSVTPQRTNSLLVGAFVLGDDAKTFSAGTGTTLDGSSGATVRIGLASRTTTSTSTHSLNLTSSASDGWGVFAIEFKSIEAGSSERTMYLQGKGVGSSERTMYVPVVSTGSSERNLYLMVKDTGSSERSMYVLTVGQGSSERGLYVVGALTGESERGLYVEVNAQGSSERSTYMNVVNTATSERGLYLIGALQGSSERNLYLQGKDTGSSERTMYLIGSKQGSSERSMYLHGAMTGTPEMYFWDGNNWIQIV